MHIHQLSSFMLIHPLVPETAKSSGSLAPPDCKSHYALNPSIASFPFHSYHRSPPVKEDFSLSLRSLVFSPVTCDKVFGPTTLYWKAQQDRHCRRILYVFFSQFCIALIVVSLAKDTRDPKRPSGSGSEADTDAPNV